MRRVWILFLLLAAIPCLAQEGMGNECTLAGTWYGGSGVAYQLTIVPSTPAGHYTFVFKGMYVNPAAPLAADPSGELVKTGKGEVYEGSMLSLAGDKSFIDLPPGANGKLPDLVAGWNSMELVDCNTIRNTIPFFGLYAGPLIWTPGSAGGPNWIANAKVPLLSEPDVDLIPVVTGGGTKPIVETYHRMPTNVNRTLDAFHK